jgi:hypothetical protein
MFVDDSPPVVGAQDVIAEFQSARSVPFHHDVERFLNHMAELDVCHQFPSVSSCEAGHVRAR